MLTKQERRAVALLTPIGGLTPSEGRRNGGGVEGRLEKGTEGKEGGKAVVGI